MNGNYPFQLCSSTVKMATIPLTHVKRRTILLFMTSKPLNIKQFMKRFPTDEACLEHLMRTRFGVRFTCPKCQSDSRYYKVKARRCYECERCGNQIYPTAGTPFNATRTPLRDWYYVMFLFCASRNGVAAMEIKRQIGVTYKCAWRMGHEIRKYMGHVDGDTPLGGSGPDSKPVEIDKTFIGGKDIQAEKESGKSIVLGMVERGGEVVTRQIPSRKKPFVVPHIEKWVKPGSRVATDEAVAFEELGEMGYRHGTVVHSAKEYVRGDVHTNTIEAFWANLKRGIKGTYVSVSSQHLQKYLWEFEYRHNLRKQPQLMFELLLQAFPRHDPTPWPKAGA